MTFNKYISCLILGVLCLAGLSSQLTAAQLIRAVNLARTSPSTYAAWVLGNYTSKGVNGITGDTNCYTEAYNYLISKQPISAAPESIVADISSWRHSNWMNQTGTFSHTGYDNTTPGQRLGQVGTYPPGATGWTENIAKSSSRTKAYTGEDWILNLIIDCGVSSRGHRYNVYSSTVNFVGCADVANYITCDGTTYMSLRSNATDYLALAGVTLENNALNSTYV